MKRKLNIIRKIVLICASLIMIQCCDGGGDGSGNPRMEQLNLGDIVLGSNQPPQIYDGLPDDPGVPVQGNIRSAWEIEVGSPYVVVAVLDTGIDWYHPDLREVIWINDGEDINGNGIAEQSDLDGVDNDENGYVDDIIGWDFVRNDNNPLDTHGHGTSVSSVITATTNNGIGIAGFTWNCPIMPIRVRSTLATDYRTVAKGIQYAIENGANVINLSLGGQKEPYPDFREVIRSAYESGILIIGSAGNQNSSVKHYPDAYPEVISIAAVDGSGRKKSYSNYGYNVEVCAQTDNMTALLGGGYGFGGGTSHSTPCVAALGALLFSQFPYLTNVEVRAIIRLTADPIDQLNPKYAGMLGTGKINFFKALDSGG